MMREARVPSVTWNPKELDKRPVFQIWPDRFVRLDSVSQTMPSEGSARTFNLYVGFSEFNSKPPVRESYQWDEWLARVKVWHEWVRSWRLDYCLDFPDGQEFDIPTGDTWSVRGRDWIESLDEAVIQDVSGRDALPWLNITFFDAEEKRFSARQITIRVEPIPVVPQAHLHDPRHIHALQFRADEIKWEPLSYGIEDYGKAARMTGVPAAVMKARATANWDKMRRRPPADDIPLSARYDELQKRLPSEQGVTGEILKTMERHLGSPRKRLRLGNKS